MASMMSRSRNAGQKKRDEAKAKAKAEAAKAGDKKTAPKRGKQGVGGPGTIVKGSAPRAKTTKIRKAGSSPAPKAKTTKANAGAGARRAAAAAASGPPRSVRKDVRNRDTDFRSADTAAAAPAAAAAAAGPSVDIIAQKNDAAKKKLAAQKRLASSGKKDAPSGGSSEKGFFGKLGDKVKKATTLTKDRPRKPLGSAAKSPTKMRKYKSDMKAWRAKQESSNAKSAGGRVGKTAARTSVKKKSPRRP